MRREQATGSMANCRIGEARQVRALVGMVAAATGVVCSDAGCVDDVRGKPRSGASREEYFRECSKGEDAMVCFRRAGS